MLKIDVYDRETDVVDTIDFWSLDYPSEHFFGQSETGKAAEVEALAADFRRVERQTRELLVLMPAREETILEQWRGAADTIEAQIKKLLGREVNYSPEPQRKLCSQLPVSGSPLNAEPQTVNSEP